MTTLRKFGNREHHIPVWGDVYIETGLDNGNSMANAVAFNHPPFAQIIGIEIHPEYAGRCRERFDLDSRVKIHTGNSVDVLPEIINPLKRTVFWLDAHWCEATRGEQGRESPSSPCVLLEELRIIKAIPWRVKPTILIDDAVVFCSWKDGPANMKPDAKDTDYPTFQGIYDALGGPTGDYQFVIGWESDGGVIYCF